MADNLINGFNVDGTEYDMEDTAARKRAEEAYKISYEVNKLINEPEPAWVTHRSIYRGKNLGNILTQEQKEHIADGTFEDMYIGDYWVDSEGNEWLIADINYLRGSYNTPNLVVVPRKGLYGYHMHTEKVGTTAIPYIKTDMFANGLTKAKNLLTSLFGEDHLFSRSWIVFTNVTSTNKSFGNIDSFCDLMSLDMIYGYSSYQDVNGVAGVVPTTESKQLPLFAMRPDLIYLDENRHYWTQSLFGNYRQFAMVYNNIVQGSDNLTDSAKLVRPFAVIK